MNLTQKFNLGYSQIRIVSVLSILVQDYIIRVNSDNGSVKLDKNTIIKRLSEL